MEDGLEVHVRYISTFLFNTGRKGVFWGGPNEDPFEVAREYLGKLSHNMLRPYMCARHNTKPLYGVSVGVHTFVRPLYLYKKLYTFKKFENGETIRLEDVKAFKIREKNSQLPQQQPTSEPPCAPCECFFNGFTSKCEFPIGNCAEYDVIENNGRSLLWTEEGKLFVDACKKHLTAFNDMNAKEISIKESRENFEIIKDYFGEVHGPPTKPTVLTYKWDPEEKKFHLISLRPWQKQEEYTARDKRRKTF